jgi:hypothetical protein
VTFQLLTAEERVDIYAIEIVIELALLKRPEGKDVQRFLAPW